MMRTPLGICVCLLLLLGPVAADDKPAEKPKPLTAEQAADAVLEAVKVKDDAALKALAAKDDPDPWLVADELCYRGEHDAAEAFSKAAARKAMEQLPAYVASRRGKPLDEKARGALAAMDEALRTNQWQEALEVAEGASETLDPVVRIRIAYGRGLALQSLKQCNESADSLVQAGDAGRRLGWLRRAAMAFHQAGMSAYQGSDWRRATLAWESRLGIERALGSQSRLASTLMNIGVLRRRLGLSEEALAFFDESLKIERALGDQATIGKVLANIGNVQLGIGRYAEALETYYESLKIARALGIKSGVSLTLNNIGSVHTRQGRYTEASECLDEALAIDRELGDMTGVARALCNIGILRENQGLATEALQALAESLRLSRELRDRHGVATLLVNIAGLQTSLGRYQEALRHYDDALHVSRELGSKKGEATALRGLGNVHSDQGRYLEALERYADALELGREIGDRSEVAALLHAMGTVEWSLGTYPEALSHYEASLETWRELGERPRIATALNDIGRVHASLGNYAEALWHHEESLRISREIGHKAGVAEALNRVGGVQLHVGRLANALAAFDAALKIKRELGAEPGIVGMLGNIGTVYARLGAFPKALMRYDAALRGFRALGDDAAVAMTLANIASVHAMRGDHAQALVRLREALRVYRELGHGGGVATALFDIGMAQADLGDYRQAHEAYEQALSALDAAPVRDTRARVQWGMADLYLRQRQPGNAAASARKGVAYVADLFAGLAEEQGAGGRDLFSGLFDTGLRAALRAGHVGDLLWFLEQGRAGSLREVLGSRAALEAAVIPTDLRKALTLARHGERQARQAYGKAGESRNLNAVRSARMAWLEAEAEVGRVSERIQREAKRATAVTLAAPDDLDTIRGRLRTGEALLLFGLTMEEGVALILTKDSARMVALPASKEIEAAAEAMLDDPDLHVAPGAVLAVLKLLIEPLKLSKDVKRVLVSPVGRLGYVPFTLLLPDKEIAYVPSGTTYGLLLEERTKRGDKILALGDPDYEAAVNKTALALHRGGGSTRLPQLPATRNEVEAIGTLTLLSTMASETGLQDAIKKQGRWRAVHFACHGLVDPERPMLSSLALTADAGNDGFLTALEIFRMKIPADLVVMSACETGKGRIYKTEGIVGLTRAFMFAGAPRVICSLWKVDDEATQALMIKFYELWNPKDGKTGLGAAAALKKAQEYIRSQDKWKHPYYWAAWVLWGLPD